MVSCYLDPARESHDLLFFIKDCFFCPSPHNYQSEVTWVLGVFVCFPFTYHVTSFTFTSCVHASSVNPAQCRSHLQTKTLADSMWVRSASASFTLPRLLCIYIKLCFSPTSFIRIAYVIRRHKTPPLIIARARARTHAQSRRCSSGVKLQVNCQVSHGQQTAESNPKERKWSERNGGKVCTFSRD